MDVYYKYAFIASAVLFWLSTLYALATWYRLKAIAPDTEGPFYRKSVPVISRLLFYSASMIWLIYAFLPGAYWEYLMSDIFLYTTDRLLYAAMFSIFFSEMFRAGLLKKPWSNRKHITIATSGAIVVFYISMKFYMQTRG